MLRSTLSRGFATETGGGGIFSGITSRIQASQENKKADLMKKQQQDLIKQMHESPSFNMRDYRDMMKNAFEKSGGNSWYSKIPGLKKVSGAEELEKILPIFDAMTPEELDDATKLKTYQKERIAVELGMSENTVEEVIGQYKQFEMMHRWLQMRKESNVPIDTSFDQIALKMNLDRRGMPARVPPWQVAAARKEFHAKNQKKKKRGFN